MIGFDIFAGALMALASALVIFLGVLFIAVPMGVCFTRFLLGVVHIWRCIFDPEYPGARK